MRCTTNIPTMENVEKMESGQDGKEESERESTKRGREGASPRLKEGEKREERKRE